MAMNTPATLDRRLRAGLGQYVTEAARQAVARANVVVGGKRLWTCFPIAPRRPSSSRRISPRSCRRSPSGGLPASGLPCW